MLADVTSLDDLLGRISERAKSTPTHRVVFGVAWDESNWDVPVLPTRADLDRAAADHPVVIKRVDGHLWTVNSKTLKRIAANDDLPREQRSRLAEVSADGMLREDDIGLVSPIAAATHKEMRDGVVAAAEYARSLGVACMQDMGSTSLGNTIGGPGRLLHDCLRELDQAGSLGVRVVVSLKPGEVDGQSPEQIAGKFGGKTLSPGPVKLFLDGSIGAQTAAITGEFADSPGNSGLLMWDEGELDPLVTRLHAAGFQLALHAIGDRAIAQALRVIERALELHPRDDHRHRIEHAEIITDEQIAKMAELGVIASMQPNFVGRWQGAGELYDSRLGSRKDALNPMRKILDAGVRLTFGSDGMPFGPLYGIASAMDHTTPAESLSFEEALHAYTATAAFAGRIDDTTGTLKVGKQADVTILSADPADGADVKVEQTLLAGDSSVLSLKLT